MYLQRVGEGLPQPMLAVVLSTTAQKQYSTKSQRRLPSPWPLTLALSLRERGLFF